MFSGLLKLNRDKLIDLLFTKKTQEIEYVIAILNTKTQDVMLPTTTYVYDKVGDVGLMKQRIIAKYPSLRKKIHDVYTKT